MSDPEPSRARLLTDAIFTAHDSKFTACDEAAE